MSKQILEFLELLIRLVIIPAIPILSKYATTTLKNWADSKAIEIENATISEYLIEINEVISQAVLSTTQTYVDTLKAEGKFDAEAQKLAFEKTKTIVMALLAQDAKEFLADMYGDIDLWLDTKIEQMVIDSKK